MKPGLLRLLSLREQTEAVEETMIDERARFARIAKKGPTGAVSSFNLFETPVAIAARMIAMAGPLEGLRVLEPSAGLGRLYNAASAGDWVLVENAPQCCEHLYRLGAKLIQDDFLACDEVRLGGKFDRIVMNPPFHRGTDCRHFSHARRLLRKSGMIVGLCYDGVQQNRVLKPIADTWEVLPSDTFKECGLTVSTVLLTIRN